jgi:hypothetical protein
MQSDGAEVAVVGSERFAHVGLRPRRSGPHAVENDIGTPTGKPAEVERPGKGAEVKAAWTAGYENEVCRLRSRVASVVTVPARVDDGKLSAIGAQVIQ